MKLVVIFMINNKSLRISKKILGKLKFIHLMTSMALTPKVVQLIIKVLALRLS
jgi:hypothetical protein